MRGFKIADGDLVITSRDVAHGDKVIKSREIEYVDGNDLTVQTMQSVLSTNKGEWLFDEDEGINFNNILGE